MSFQIFEGVEYTTFGYVICLFITSSTLKNYILGLGSDKVRSQWSKFFFAWAKNSFLVGPKDQGTSSGTIFKK
jgi:hypothetical protein